MDIRIHNIELFKRLIAPRHTAFNVRASKQRPKKRKKSNLKKNKPPPALWGCSEPLNVLDGKSADCGFLYRFCRFALINKICLRCRAPPCIQESF